MSDSEDVMELLMPLTVDEVLEERRKTASRKAVVVESEREAAMLREVVEEGVRVITFGAPCPPNLDLIVMLAKPDRQHDKWFDLHLMNQLRPGGHVLWATTRLSLA